MQSFWQAHFKELLQEHAPPSPAIAEYAVANLIKMGFPQRGAETIIAICSCHKEPKVGGGYTCPRCFARVCELPTECNICGLTLVSSPHLARSYHHLFPVLPFDEASVAPLNSYQKSPRTCFGCQQDLLNYGKCSAMGRFFENCMLSLKLSAKNETQLIAETFSSHLLKTC